MAASSRTVAHRLRVDSGRTHLPLCPCGWRGIPTPNLTGAWHQAALHESQVHPDNGRQAVKAYEDAKRRAATRP